MMMIINDAQCKLVEIEICHSVHKVRIKCFKLKVREGRRAAHFPKLCVFLDYNAISEHM